MAIKVGVIGIGFIGRVHVEQLKRIGSIDVVAIVNDINAKEIAKELSVDKYYSDYKEMIDNEKLDCVHICTPNFTHYEIAMYAMERNINVVCEKPMAINHKEALEMTAYAREKGLVNAINYHCRFYPMIYQMKKMRENGELGEIYSVNGGYLQDWLFFKNDYNWRLISKFGGMSRAFSDIGTHWIDSVKFISGMTIKSLFADLTTFHKTRKKPKGPVNSFEKAGENSDAYEEYQVDTEDYAVVLFRFENGAIASCNISQMFAGKKNQMQIGIAGSKSSVMWNSEKINSLWIGRKDKPNMELVKDLSLMDPETAKAQSYPGGHVEGFGDAFKHNFIQIYKAIGGEEYKSFATFEDGAYEMYLVDKIIESNEKKAWIDL